MHTAARNNTHLFAFETKEPHQRTKSMLASATFYLHAAFSSSFRAWPAVFQCVTAVLEHQRHFISVVLILSAPAPLFLTLVIVFVPALSLLQAFHESFTFRLFFSCASYFAVSLFPSAYEVALFEVSQPSITHKKAFLSSVLLVDSSPPFSQQRDVWVAQSHLFPCPISNT